MKINIELAVVKQKTKSGWKKEVKQKIAKEIEREFQEEAMQKTKLRFLRGKSFKQEEYVEKCDAEMVGKIMRIRLNMVECKMNYKGNSDNVECIMCNEKETTEHLFDCQYYKQFTGTHEMRFSEKDYESTEWLIKAARNMDIIQEVRGLHLRV